MRNFWSKYTNSIKTRLITNVILIHAILMGFVVFDMLQREHIFMEKQLSSKGVDLTTILSSNSASALLNNDIIALNELISEIKNVSDSYMVFILNRDGTVRASDPESYFNQTFRDNISLSLLKELENGEQEYIQKLHDDLVDTVANVYVDGQTIGFVRTILDSRRLSEEIEIITNRGFVYILIAILIGSLFAWLSVRRMTYNLNRIKNVSEELANRNISVKLPDIDDRDEVGAMAKAFSVMQESLNQYLEEIHRNEERLKLALEGSNDGLWDWNLVTNEVYFSPRYKEMLGYSDNEFPNSFEAWKNSLYKEDREKTLQFIENFLESNRVVFELRFKLKTSSGHYIPILSRAKKVFDKNGKAVRMVGTHVDMSEIDRVKHLLQTIVDSIDIPLMVIDKNYNVTLVNRAIREQHKNSPILDPKHPKHPKCYELSHEREIPCDGVDHPCPLHHAVETKSLYKTVHTHRFGEKREVVELSAYPMINRESGEVEAIIETAYDITKLVDTQDELRYQAQHDNLTELPNRMLFLDRLKQAIKSGKRDNRKVAVLFLDLDRFKEVNDSLGHDAGDILLKDISLLLKNSIRDSDTVARLGGDEFTIILDNIEKSEIIVDTVKRIMININNPHTIKGREFYTTFSIGVSIYPEDGDDAVSLLKNADAAMYRAKSEGRNNYQFYTKDMTEKALERISLETNLRQAIEYDSFDVFYQPQVNMINENIVGMEALVRWNHPQLGNIPPYKFIPLAEETGLIIEMDRLTIKKAMRQYAKWIESGYEVGVLSLNLSIVQLGKSDFIDFVKETLNEISLSKKSYV